MTRGSRGLAWVLAAVMWAGGCAPPEPARWYEGEHLRVGTYFEEPRLCRGMVSWLDGAVERMASDLDVGLGPQIDVYWLRDGEDLADRIPAGCRDRTPGGGAQGCTVLGRTVYGVPAALEHELAHVLMARVGDLTNPFFQEGLAVALPNNRVLFGGSRPTENLRKLRRNLDFATAGHFMRFAMETEGIEGVRNLVRRSGVAPRRAFERSFGVSVEEMEARYLEEAPWSFPQREPCAYPELDEVAPGRWDETVEVDCDAPDTEGVADTPNVPRSLVVREAGAYNVYVEPGGHASFLHCQLDPVPRRPNTDEPPWSIPQRWGVVPDQSWFYASNGIPIGVANQVRTLWLEAGTYEVRLGLDGRQVGQVRIQIWPALRHAERVPLPE